MTKSIKKLNEYFILLIFPVLFLLMAFFLESPSLIFENMVKIIVEKDILLTDYLEVGGISATFINASLVTILAIILLHKTGKEIDGLAIASIFTIFGFAFIGKNILNVLPIYLGGYLYTKYTDEEMKNIIISLIFGTTLAPIIGEVIFGYSLDYILSIPLGLLLGIIIGFVMAPLGRQMAKLHEGYNLYNIGFTGGIIATVIASIFRSFGVVMETQMVVSTKYSNFMMLLLIVCFLGLAILGYSLDREGFKKYKYVLKETGIAPNDFNRKYGQGTTYINMGIMGIIAIIYILISKGDFNGPTIAGIFTVAGFAASGKHPKNTIPVLLGVFLAAKLNTMDPSSPSVIIAGLFGTTLAPIAGDFGYIAGIIAGFLHISVGSNILKVHGGINLYNNGFSGGIVAATMLPVCIMIRDKKDKGKYNIERNS